MKIRRRKQILYELKNQHQCYQLNLLAIGDERFRLINPNLDRSADVAKKFAPQIVKALIYVREQRLKYADNFAKSDLVLVEPDDGILAGKR